MLSLTARSWLTIDLRLKPTRFDCLFCGAIGIVATFIDLRRSTRHTRYTHIKSPQDPLDRTKDPRPITGDDRRDKRDHRPRKTDPFVHGLYGLDIRIDRLCRRIHALKIDVIVGKG